MGWIELDKILRLMNGYNYGAHNVERRLKKDKGLEDKWKKIEHYNEFNLTDYDFREMDE